MFSERLQKAREKAGLTKAELGRHAGGISGSAISQLESGLSKGAKPENLVALAKALGVEIEWLATGNGPMIAVASDGRPVSSQGALLAELIDIFLGVEGLERKKIFVEACRVFVSDEEGLDLNREA